MNIIIENEYKNTIDIDYEPIIISVINETVNYVECPYECEVNVLIVDNKTIHQINFEQRNIDNATDVLSFPFLKYKTPANFENVYDDVTCFEPDTGELLLGDIVLCFDKILEQAKEYNHSIKRELAFLVAHSMLHLFGYDHIEDDERICMEQKQQQILKNLGITREI